jgi:hypothetical protein
VVFQQRYVPAPYQSVQQSDKQFIEAKKKEIQMQQALGQTPTTTEIPGGPPRQGQGRERQRVGSLPT